MAKSTHGRRKTPSAKRTRILVGPTSTTAALAPTCFFSEDGTFLLRNLELFRPGHEQFCGRLVQAIAKQDGVRSVRVSLASGTCHVECQSPDFDRVDIAGRVASAIHQAISPEANDAGNSSHETWLALSAFRANNAISLWQTVSEGPGRLRLSNRLMRVDGPLAHRVARSLAAIPGVSRCRTTFGSRDLDIHYDPASIDSVTLTRAAADAFEAAFAPAHNQPPALGSSSTPALAKGAGRIWCLVLATGSFALTIVGIVLPIVPTVPFLMATSYYLVRASPMLNRWLLRAPFLGPILEDLQTWGGLRPINKGKLIGVALAVAVVSTAVIGPPLIVILMMVGVYSTMVYFVVRMPGVPGGLEQAEPSRQLAAVPG